MSDYKKSLTNRFGLGVTVFKLDDLNLKEGQELPAELVGQEIHVKKLSGKQFEDFAASNAELKKDDGDLVSQKFLGLRAKFIAMCQCDPEGNLLWESADECNEALNNISIGGFFAACQQVNGLNPKAAEEAEKN